MALESASFISGLNESNPLSTDAVSQADDHIRLIKSAVKGSFPNISGAVTKTHTQLNNALDKTGDTMTGPLVLPGVPTTSLQAATKGYVDSAVAAATAGVSSFSAGSTGLTPSTSSTGAVTLGGTLALANGGTGATTAANARTNLGVPSTTGTGASGTWGISISGSAATAAAVDALSATAITNQFESSKSSNGYQELPSGVIIQWGTFVPSASTSSVTFPIAFPNACYSITLSTVAGSGGGVNTSHAVLSFTSSTASLSTNSGNRCYWMAIGS